MLVLQTLKWINCRTHFEHVDISCAKCLIFQKTSVSSNIQIAIGDLGQVGFGFISIR